MTDQDKTIASLKALIADLNQQITSLLARISTLSANAQRAVKDKNRVSALAALRTKKLNETALAQRSETLSLLEEVYSNIEQAADQVAIVCVMKDSTSVLRNLHTEVGNVDKVDNVVADLRDEMDKVDEVGSIIEAGGQGQNVVDEDAVDEELESLERQAKSELEEKEARQTQERFASIGSGQQIDELKESQQQHAHDSAPEAPNKTQDVPAKEGINALERLSLNSEQAPVG